MSKNLSRKGLALGAVVALGSTLFAGAPANAAAALAINPASGTTWNVLSSDTFTIKATGNVDLAESQNAKLRWEVTNSAAVPLTYTVSDSQASPANLTENVDGTDGAASSGTSDIVKAVTSNTTVGQYNTLNINPTTSSTTPSATVSVRAFIDVDLSGSVTDGDIVSASQTINFKTGIVPTVVLDDVVAGSQPTATVTLSGDINYAQTTLENVAVEFYETTGAGSSIDAITEDQSSRIALNTAKTAIEFTAAGASIAASDTVRATGYVENYDGIAYGSRTTSNTTAGTAVYKSAAKAGSATGVTISFANSASIRSASSSDANGSFSASSASSTASAALAKVVRKGTKAVSFKVAFTKSPDTDTVASGDPVKVVITEGAAAGAFAADEEITAGGKTLKNASDTTTSSVTYYTTTGTDGTVAIDLAAKNGDAGTGLKITVSAGASFATTAGLTLLWATANADSLVETSERLGNDSRIITKGGTVGLSYELLDEWGQPYAAADTSYEVRLTEDGANTNVSTTVALSGGKGAITWTDNSTATGTYTISAALYSKTTGNWAAQGASNIYGTARQTSGATETTGVSVVSALPTAATVTFADAVLANGSTAIATTGVPLSNKALAAGDSRFNKNSVVIPAYADANGAQISGTITDAAGGNVEGVAVTIKASNVAFLKSGVSTGSVSALGSITVYTTSNGSYSVKAFSKVSGDVVFTATAGSATKTQTVTFAKAAEEDAASVTVSAVKTTKTGRAITVTVTVLDANGNAIDTDGAAASGVTDTLDITIDGAGYTYTVPTSTNAKGQASFKLVYLPEDKGVTAITASFDADGAATEYETLTGTAQVLAGVTATIAKAAKSVSATVKYAKGATIKVVRGSKVATKVATSDSYKVTLKATSGTTKVYVNDVLVASKK